MLRFFSTSLAVMMGMGIVGHSPLANAEADERTVLTLSPDIREQFLQEMRGHMENLDAIIAAIGAGDFAEAALIADTRLDFGHHIWEAMAAKGATAEEIAAAKKRMHSKGLGMRAGMSDEEHKKMEEKMAGMGMGKGGGMGRHMTPEFRPDGPIDARGRR